MKPQLQSSLSESSLVNVTGVAQGNLSREQYNYATAKVLYDQRYAAYRKRVAAERPLDHVQVNSEADVENFVTAETDLLKECRVEEAFQLLIEAENQLIKWGDHAARRSLGKRYKQIAEAFKSGPKSKLRPKLIDICMKMVIL